MLNFLNRKKILVTGGAGFLGSFVTEELIKNGIKREDITVPRSKDLDLRNRENCSKAVKGQDVVIHLAAHVGGIGYNKAHPGELFYDNIMIGTEIMESARKEGIKKFTGVGTICSYPKFADIPFKEEDLWDGHPEETNAPYGLAKKMLVVQASAYRDQYGFNAINLLPVNLYGPRDNFDESSSHVIPALIKKIIHAKENNFEKIEVWGTGKATREFFYVEDAAKAIVMAAEKYNKPDPVNLGSGTEISIKDLVNLLVKLCGYKGEIIWDESKPDGQPRRLLDTNKAFDEFGFKAETSFEDGLKKTIDWYISNKNE